MCAMVQSRGHRPLHTTCTGTPATRPPPQLHFPARLPPPVRRTLVRWWSTRRLDHLYLKNNDFYHDVWIFLHIFTLFGIAYRIQNGMIHSWGVQLLTALFFRYIYNAWTVVLQCAPSCVWLWILWAQVINCALGQILFYMIIFYVILDYSKSRTLISSTTGNGDMVNFNCTANYNWGGGGVYRHITRGAGL